MHDTEQIGPFAKLLDKVATEICQPLISAEIEPEKGEIVFSDHQRLSAPTGVPPRLSVKWRSSFAPTSG